MMKFLGAVMNRLDTPAGHLVVGLFLFLSGIGMVKAKVAGGDAVITSSVASVFTSMRAKEPKQ
jgi:hypothetical protein